MRIGQIGWMVFQSLARAWRETFQNRVAAAIMAAVAFAITFAIYWYGMGPSVALDELWIWIASGVGMFGSLVLLFLFNLACAPYRIERDRRKQLEAESVGRSVPGVLGAFRNRKAYTLAEIARLLTTTTDHRELALADLKKAIARGDLEPLKTARGFDGIALKMARTGATSPSGEALPDHLEVGSDALREYLPKAGYPLPEWLQDKPA